MSALPPLPARIPASFLRGAVLLGFVLLGAAPALAQTPAAPTALTSDPGDGDVSVQWTKPSGSITGYDYSTDDGSTWTAVPSSGATTECYTIPSLTNSTAYNIKIRAKNANGDGTASARLSATPSATSLKASLEALYDSTAGASWTTKTNWKTCEKLSTWHGVIVRSGNVTQLRLSSNNLAGPLPTQIGNFPNLKFLYLTRNSLTGSIPTQIGSLTNLTQLTLDHNGLTGSIPTEIGNLTKLTRLVLNNNKLTGGIPTQIGNLTKLTRLQLNNNKTLNGSLPTQLGNLTELTHLWLGGNQFSGGIPSQLKNLTSLVELQLNHNKLTSIPSGLGALTSLTHFHAQRNELTGSIPTDLGSMTSLQQLWLNNNSLTGSIPSQLGSLSALTQLTLNSNSLSGSIPSQLGSLSSLTQFRLEANQLTGTVPAALASLSNVTDFRLHQNKLTGSLPSAFTGMSKLRLFAIFHNRGLCAPKNSSFNTWISGIGRFLGPRCTPVNLRATPGNAEVELAWDTPPGSAILYWQFQQDGGSWTRIPSSRAATNSYTVTGLTNGTEYKFKVRAFNGWAGAWPPSDEVKATPSAPAVTLLVRPNPLDEGSTATVTASLSRAGAADVTITVSAAKGTAEDGDYTLTGSTLTIAAGSTTSTGTVTLTAVEDTDNDDETVILSGTVSSSQDPPAAPADVTVTLYDDEDPVLTLKVTPNPVAEGSTADVTACVSRRSDSVVLQVKAEALTAEPGDFFIQGNASQLVIPKGTKPRCAPPNLAVRIVTVDDGSADTDDETVRISATVSGGSPPAPSPVTLTISDDEKPNPPPVVTLVVNPDRLNEGETATVTATMAGTTTAATTLTVSAAAGSGTDPDDFRLVGTTLTFAAGGTNSSGTVSLAALQDADARDETVVVSAAVSNSTDNPVAPSPVTVTVVDDDEPAPPPRGGGGGAGTAVEAESRPDVFLTATPNPVDEGRTTRITARIAGTTSSPTRVTVRAAPGTAEAGDFALGPDATLTIPAGTNSASDGAVTLEALHDSDTDDETVIVSGRASNANDPEDLRLTIRDDDRRVLLTVAPNPVKEGASAAVTARIRGTTTVPTTVNILLDPVTSEPGDFTLAGAAAVSKARMKANGGYMVAIVIPPGTNPNGSMAVEFIANEDGDTEDETVRVSGSVENPTDDIRSPELVMVRVMDNDDPQVVLTVSPNPLEEGGTASVSARIEGTTRVATTVTLSAAGGSAEAGDVSLLGGQIVIPAGRDPSGRSTAAIVAHQDEGTEDETVVVSATVESGDEVVLAPDPVELAITDDDDPQVVLTVSPNPLAEGGSATVTARIEGTTTVPTTLTLAAGGGTAEAGDFTLGSATLVIPAGRDPGGEEGVNLTANPDPDADDETVLLTAEVENGAERVLAPEPQMVAITDAVSEAELGLLPEVARAIGGRTTRAVAERIREARSGRGGSARAGAGGSRLLGAFGAVRSALGAAASGNCASAGGFAAPWRGSADLSQFSRWGAAAASAASGNRVSTGGLAAQSQGSAGLQSAPQQGSAGLQSAPQQGSAGLQAGTASAASGAHPSGSCGTPLEALGGGWPSLGSGGWQQALSGAGFSLPLGGADDKVRGGPATGFSSLSLWGGADLLRMDGRNAELDWDGGLFSALLGADLRPTEGLLAGLMLSWHDVGLDYRLGGGDGAYDVGLLGIHPYLGWSTPSGGVELWGTAGYGAGDLDLGAVSGSTATSGVELRTAATGGSAALLTRGGAGGATTEVRVKGDVFQTRLGLDGSASLPSLTVDTWQLRTALEASRRTSLGGGRVFVPSLEVGVRHAGGDGPTGAGMEVGGGLRYEGGRLRLDGQAHGLLLREDYREWGVRGMLAFAPAEDGRGLSASLRAGAGMLEPGGSVLWERELRDLGGMAGAAAGRGGGGRMEAEVGYGVFGPGRRGLLTPYGTFRFEDAGRRAVEAGMRWKVGRGFQLAVSGQQNEWLPGTAERALLLRGAMTF